MQLNKIVVNQSDIYPKLHQLAQSAQLAHFDNDNFAKSDIDFKSRFEMIMPTFPI